MQPTIKCRTKEKQTQFTPKIQNKNAPISSVLSSFDSFMLFLCIYFDNFNFRLFQETQLQFNSIFSQKSAQFHLHFARRANKMIRKTKEQSPIATPKTNLFSSPIQNVMDFTDLCSRMYGRNCSNKANAIRPIY